MRRRPADPGLRPRGRFAAGTCRVCAAAFVLDREVQPWARARTCSDSCRAVLGNRGRSALTCEHCVMVEGFHAERCRQLAAAEDDRDETAAGRVIVFRSWLRHYPWPSGDVVAAWSEPVSTSVDTDVRSAVA